MRLNNISREKRKTEKKLHNWYGTLLVSVIFLLSICLLSGCSAGQKQEESSNLKKIIVGIDKFEPYTYQDVNGNYTGIDIELAKQIFHELGYEPEFEFIPWNQKNAYLEDGTIDCIWSCYSMNNRENDYEWAGPYLYSRQVVAVSAESDIQTLNDLAGKDIGVQSTTRAADLFLHKIASDLPEAGQVNCFSSTADLFASIRKGYVDAIAGHEALINELVKSSDGEIRLLEESPHISKIGVAFEKGTHVELVQKMNSRIAEMSADGTIGTIAAKYGLDAEKVVVGGDSDAK